MEMILGKREAVDEACFKVSLKHFRCGMKYSGKLKLKGLQMDMIVGEKGGQRSWTKRVSGLVSNMLRCGLKYSRKLALKGMQMGIYWGKRG